MKFPEFDFSIMGQSWVIPAVSDIFFYELSTNFEASLTLQLRGNARPNRALISTVCQVFLLFLLLSFSLLTGKNLG